LKEYPILNYFSESAVQNTSKSILLTFAICVVFDLSWAKGSITSRLPGDTVVVEASTKSLKHKNRMRSNGRISTWEGKQLTPSTPFKGPAGYQIQMVSIPMKCQCPEIDSFEVTLIYTDLESCASTLLFQKWMKLEGLKELQIIPQQSQKTHANYLLSIKLQPNRFPKDHFAKSRNTCFYLKAGLVASDYQYLMLTDGTLLLSPSYYSQNGKYYALAPKIKLKLFK
jgi:hypothetical protein